MLLAPQALQVLKVLLDWVLLVPQVLQELLVLLDLLAQLAQQA